MKNILVITGSAPCVLDDLTALAVDNSHADFMAVGLDAVDKYPWPIKYVVTYHPVEIAQIRERRESIGGNTDYKVISYEPKPGVDIIEPHRPPSGSSALLGALAAIKLGYRRIVLCGCPLVDRKYAEFQQGWKAKQKDLDGRVRSMSGWTKEFLGAPTEEWLKDE